jgi:hypothetical protein
MRQVDQVSKLPERLPWVEGVDYDVIPNADIPYNVPVRIRDEYGETFQMNTEPGSPVEPGFKVMSKTAFQDYAVSKLGGGVVGMARFTEIMDATRDSASGAVRFAFARYEAAEMFEKTNTEMLTAVMASDSQSGHLTAQERTAIVGDWPRVEV